MLKSLVKILLVVAVSLVVIVVGFVAIKTAVISQPIDGVPTVPSESEEKTVIIDENWEIGLDNEVWKDFQNWHEEVLDQTRLPIIFENGEMKLGVGHDPNYEDFKDHYNNAFLLSKAHFQPAEGEKIVLEATFTVPEGYQGSTGVWIDASATFDDSGAMLNDGFIAGTGITYLSNDSVGSGLSGLKFIYSEGWFPYCSFSLGANPFEKHTYRLEWSAKGIVVYVDRKLAGSCSTPMFADGEVQLWSDNYYIPSIVNISNLNPDRDQYTVYDSVKVWSEPLGY